MFSHGKEFSFSHLAASLAFIPWPNNLGGIKPVLQVGWTLNYEMYFYLVFSFLLFFSRKAFLPLLTTILLGGVLVGILAAPNKPFYSLITSPILIEFLMGCLVGIIYTRRDINVSARLGTLLICICAGLLLASGLVDSTQLPRMLKWGIPSALLASGAVFVERAGKFKGHSLLEKLGDSSYSLYLTHIFTINAVGKTWSLVFSSMYKLFIPVAIITSAVIGYAAYIFLEHPITTHLNSLYASRRTRIAEASA